MMEASPLKPPAASMLTRLVPPCFCGTDTVRDFKPLVNNKKKKLGHKTNKCVPGVKLQAIAVLCVVLGSVRKCE